MDAGNLSEGRELTVRGGIRKSRLQRNAYTLSLLNEGLRTGRLNGEEAKRIQYAFMRILQELILKYTRGESTTVATETAESLLTSVLYAADAYLSDFEEPEAAIETLKTADTRLIYDRGVEKVGQTLEAAKRLYKEIAARKLEVPVDAYNMTIDESLPVFLRKYGILFDAHNTMASIDYPLAIDDMRLQGVFYIKQYLERLKLETEFCAMFDRRELLELLSNYGRVCRFDYRIELFNIFELVLGNAIFSVLAGGRAGEIRISENQFERLERPFGNAAESQIRAVFTGAMARLRDQLPIHAQLQAYMEVCSESLVQRTANAAKHGSLRTVAITWRATEAKPIVLSFDAKDRMSDVRLRKLLHELTRVETKEEKVGLIMSSFHSFYDYLDLLEADCLYGDEYDALFGAFGDMELALLAKIVFYEQLRDESADLPSILSRENGHPMEWQMRFSACLREMGRERQQAVGRLMDEMNFEQMDFR
ncbi:DUF6179 domain-containing protein [Cohnella algarum]|uniref:DUF6179 domain-containing protein n=1 Tax=Cohnella algarum TaxID=2044859 RepID=UPI0019676E0A|nr:DUF6179 domain-containing protein [Cohnella algarum]MBN2983732.1 hypothetical protein [Cohnella algarum]